MCPSRVAEVGEQQKHGSNGNDAHHVPAEGGMSVPLVVEAYGGWGQETHQAISRVPQKLSIHRLTHLDMQSRPACTVVWAPP